MRKNILLIFCLSFLLVGLFSVPKLSSQPIEKISVLWIDPLRNIERINSLTGIRDVINEAQNAGFKAIALGVKANTGEVIYSSEQAPPLLGWRDNRMPSDLDPLRIFLEEGRRRGLQIYAVFPLFAEGKMRERQGVLYDQHPEWQTTVYVVQNDEPTLLSMTKWAYGPIAYANPLSREVQNYELAVVREFLEKYTVDGIIFDKGRFYSIKSDFSETTKQQFQRYVGSEIDWWPQDIYELQFINDEWQVVPGNYFQDWIQFRAAEMKSFYQRLITAVGDKDPSLPIGNFVGGWYTQYYEHGVNWASESNLPEEDWASRDYYKTAIAEMFDYLIVGCFFPRIGMQEAEQLGAPWWLSVEGSATLAMEVVDKQCPVYGAILAQQFKGDGQKFKQALKTAVELTDGLYVHDLSFIEENRFWDELRSVLRQESSVTAPSDKEF